MKCVVALLSCLLFVSGAAAQPAPKGPAPILKVVASVDAANGMIHFKETVIKHVPVVKEIEVIVNGEKVKQAVIEQVPVLEERTIQIEAAKCRIITPDGKKLPLADVWKRVKANTVVAVSENNTVPDAAFLRALNPETVVIIQAAVKN